MIVAVCSDKGSPGVTTLAMALALAWPGQRLLLEADTSGGDVMFRAHAPGKEYLEREPTAVSLAIDSRSGASRAPLASFAQDTTLGVPMIAGVPSSRAWKPVRHLWSHVAQRVQEWPGTVVVDLGRLQDGHPAFALAQAADVLLFLTQASIENLFRVRERTSELAADPIGHPVGRSMGVVVRVGPQDRESQEEVTRMLTALGSPIQVIGAVADDAAGVQKLVTGHDSTDLRTSALMRSSADLVTRIRRSRKHGTTAAADSDPRARGRARPRVEREEE